MFESPDMSRPRTLRQHVHSLYNAVGSLQVKASALIVLLVIVVTIVSLAVSIRLTARAVYGQSKAQALAWAESLASGAAGSVARSDMQTLNRIVHDTLQTGRICFLVFTDQRGRTLAWGQDSHAPPTSTVIGADARETPPRRYSPRLVHDSSTGLAYMDVTVPVYNGNPGSGRPNADRQVAGYLRLAANVSDAEASLRRMAGYLQCLSALMVLMVIPCSLWAMRKVVAPLNELSRTAKELASGVMDARARVSAHNEIGDLARAFNEMVGRLAGAQFEMLKLNAELEERVQQRTHQLEDLASREPLTGLYNRRYFTEVLSREFAAAERYDADLTVLMFDLDHFKETNDRFGHRAGDEVLVLLADSIRNELREADVAARFGGDEFILLLPRTSGSAAAHVAERITDRFMETLAREFPDYPTTLSIGVASLRVTRAHSAEVLIHEADGALYAAKTGGRNRTVAASNMPC